MELILLTLMIYKFFSDYTNNYRTVTWSEPTHPRLIINQHNCVKSVQIRSIFWSVFSCIQTECEDLRRFFRAGLLFCEVTENCLVM